MGATLDNLRAVLGGALNFDALLAAEKQVIVVAIG